MEIGYFATDTGQFRQVFAWLVHEIECACVIIVGRGRRLDGHVLPRRRYVQLSWHARRCGSSGASSYLSRHRDPARTQGAECSSYRVAASATSRSEKRRPPEATRQSGKAFGYDYFTLIFLVLSAVSMGAPPRRTWSITSSRTAATWRKFGTWRTGNRFARPVTTNGKRASSAARGRAGQIAIGAKRETDAPLNLFHARF